ncbi:hypothetical protein BCR43DRAFT_470775 [Syncephalastrum racemosum]|uniref:G-protein coupled receptors family 1 profile domain-containing protein n=1 Tax=Syncephalastrum racemosum TaxID=13706 RepID=A0A1X2HHL9_SYNRA|nr:hypothetical protein BCR43DRAFT_470775 [Syncephalastrum racemosum]
MYSPDNYEILSEVISVACITAISLVFGRKAASIERPVYYIRGLLMTLYGATWAFNIIACMATSTNNGNYISCSLSLYNCIFVYTLAKILLYLYFIEKIYVISVPKSARLRTPMYLINLGLLLPYLALIALMVVFRIAQVSEAYPFHCTIGYQLPASAATLGYDALISVLYTATFIKYAMFPNTAQQTAHQASSLRLIARRSIVATVTSLITAAINYCVLIGLDGQERGLIASSICALDITIVVCVVHWVASHPTEMQCTVKALQKGSGDKPMKLEIKQHQEVVVLSEMAP